MLIGNRLGGFVMINKNKICLPKDFGLKRLAVELAGFCGYKSTNLEFPIVVKDNSEQTYVLLEETPDKEKDLLLENLVKLSNTKSKTEMTNVIRDEKFQTIEVLKKEVVDKRQIKGLESLFEIGFFLSDDDGDFLPEKLNLKISLKDEPTNKETIAAGNFAARFAMDTLGYDYPILWDKNMQTPLLIIEETQEDTVLQLQGQNIVLKGKDIDKLSTLLCNNMPYASKTKTLMDLVQSMDKALSMKNLDGQMAYLNILEKNSAPECYFSPDRQEYQAIKQTYPNAKIKSYKALKELEKREYNIVWEVDSFKEILENKVKNFVSKGNVEISYSLSEDQTSREILNNYIKESLGNVKINSVCSYKQGFSWIDEQIIPKLEQKNIDKVKIGFRSFLPEGESEWKDENGTTPKITSDRADNPDKWFDLPVRLLQELYPIDDIISEKLNVPREAIEFYVLEDKAVDYKIEAFAKEEAVLVESYKGAYAQRPYLSEYKGIGKVHPSTGYIRVKVDNELVFEENIPTDLEKIWTIYQDDILPYCKSYIMDKTNGKPKASTQPFFSQMRLDISVSEPDYRLNCREDMISSLDALHEDIYFVGLDFFKTLGLNTTGENLDAPGLILPVIKKHLGTPKMVFTLYGQEKEEACIINNGKTILGSEKTVHIKAISLEDDRIKLELEAKEDLSEVMASFKELSDKNQLKMTRDMDIVKEVNYKNISIKTHLSPQTEAISINDVDIMEDRLIGYEEYLVIMDKLSKVPELRVIEVAQSYQGRIIYAIEMMPKEKGYTSRVKAIDQRPSELVIGRHHANEVSGTNSNFMLIKTLLTEEKYKDLADKLNLVFLPMENPDGAAVHYELQKDNPHWKLHIARFNSLGKEMAGEYFNDDTIHTECMAFTKLWRKWLPDVVTDNHGVPSHEWDQQFSGYTSPWFKGFWMPRALLYSYFFHIQDERYLDNLKVNKAIEDVVAQSMKDDKEIRSWNKTWQERFEKYAHSWMPKLFPAEYYKELISYWVPSPYNEEHKYAAVRYPWITAASFVSEVSDETAQGEYLYLCARAHMTHDLAVIDMLVLSKTVRKDFSKDGKLMDKRLRPIICPTN